jgi:putative transposase
MTDAQWVRFFSWVIVPPVKKILCQSVQTIGIWGLLTAYIETIYPKTEVQLCVIHRIRNSMKYVASENQKAFMADLKCAYKETTLNVAELSFDELEAKWDDKYPVVIKPWCNKWAQR